MHVSRVEEKLKDIFERQVLEIAFRLRKEGVITEPALEWDGSLGPEEKNVIERLGFLLNAYTVQAWYPSPTLLTVPTVPHNAKHVI